LTLGHYSAATDFRIWLLQPGIASHYMLEDEGRRILKLFRGVPSLHAGRPARSALRGQGEAWLKAWVVI
jgi:hypothetical protein